MCPVITAGPGSPGSGPWVYQPVSPKSVGVCSDPSRLRPRAMTGAETPIAGIVIELGEATCHAAAAWRRSSRVCRRRCRRVGGFAGGDGALAHRGTNGADQAAGKILLGGAWPSIPAQLTTTRARQAKGAAGQIGRRRLLGARLI